MAKANGGKGSQPAKPPEVKRPAMEVRMGRIRVTAWRNVTKDGQEWFSFVPTRSYKDGDQWKSASSFGVDDLLVLAAICTQMRFRLEQQRQASRQESSPGQEQEAEHGDSHDIPF